MKSESYRSAAWGIRTAFRRQLAADVRRLRAMKQDIASLERHIYEERRRLAALDPTQP
jgi:hypothetical protein